MEVGIELVKGTGQGKQKSVGLSGDTTAAKVGFDIVLTQGLGRCKGLVDLLLEGLQRKVFVVGTAVDRDATAAGGQIDPGNSGFSPTNGVGLGHELKG